MFCITSFVSFFGELNFWLQCPAWYLFFPLHCEPQGLGFSSVFLFYCTLCNRNWFGLTECKIISSIINYSFLRSYFMVILVPIDVKPVIFLQPKEVLFLSIVGYIGSVYLSWNKYILICKPGWHRCLYPFSD